MKEEDIKKQLTPDEYHILREGGTEAPFSGKKVIPGPDGNIHCKLCNSPLFTYKSKFESGTGWPSFEEAIEGAVIEKDDLSHGMVRKEILCAKCGSHLGHLFYDGTTETKKRYCINSVCFK